MRGIRCRRAAGRLPAPHRGAPDRLPLAVERGPNAVRADGLVERRNHIVAGAWLQLLGLGVVKLTMPPVASTRVRWTTESDRESFTIPLRPRGGEQRFEMRLHSFEYPEESSP